MTWKGRLLLAVAATAVLSVAAAAGGVRRPIVRLLFGGDVMLGRGVARIGGAHPDVLLAGIGFQVSSADLAVANLESPLTRRRHDPARGPNALEASPASSSLLAAAGFGAVGIANNHAGNAGPATVTDSATALAKGGRDPARRRPLDRAGVRAAHRRCARDPHRPALARRDRSGAPARPGVAWDEPRLRTVVARTRERADVVAIGVQGGAEYVPETDPYVMRLARILGSWGVDVVWGSGAHVVQPIRLIDPNRDGRPTVVATSLGNLLFDQHISGTQRGAMLEVLTGKGGVGRSGSARRTR